MEELLYQNESWLRQKYIAEKLSTVDMARLCGIHYLTIVRWMDKFRIERRNHSEAQIIKRGEKPHTNEKWLYQKYVKEKMLVKEIARLCDCDPNTIRLWLDCFGFKRRSRETASRLYWKRQYGSWIQRFKLAFKDIAQVLRKYF